MYLRGHAHSLRANPEYVEEDHGYLTSCWIWMRGRGKSGYYGAQYGITRRPGETMPVSSHRLVYERHVGTVPEGYDLDHLCRVTLCCNPDHLEAVTHEENVRRGKNTRLTPEGVCEMFSKRALGQTFRSIAEEYGISLTHAMKIIYGKKWKGVVAQSTEKDSVLQVTDGADESVTPRLDDPLEI